MEEGRTGYLAPETVRALVLSITHDRGWRVNEYVCASHSPEASSRPRAAIAMSGVNLPRRVRLVHKSIKFLTVIHPRIGHFHNAKSAHACLCRSSGSCNREGSCRAFWFGVTTVGCNRCSSPTPQNRAPKLCFVRARCSST